MSGESSTRTLFASAWVLDDPGKGIEENCWLMMMVLIDVTGRLRILCLGA